MIDEDERSIFGSEGFVMGGLDSSLDSPFEFESGSRPQLGVQSLYFLYVPFL